MTQTILNCPPALQLLNAHTERPLAHYTSPSGLHGIITEGGFWATHSEFLNDSSESTHYIDLANTCIQTRLDKPHLASDEKVFLSLIMQCNPWRYYTDTKPRRNNVFVVSFSEEENLLSQWRAYCSNGGYSMAFSLTHLRTVGKIQGFYVGRCEYEDELKKSIIESLVDAALVEYRKGLATNGDIPNQQPGWHSTERRVLQLYERSLAHYGPLLKHRSFKEEKEWRAVLGPLPVEQSPYSDQDEIAQTMKKLKFRPGKGTVIPYCEFKYKPTEAPLTDRVAVIAGPSRMNNRGSHIVRAYVQNTFGVNASYTVSETPYDPL